MELFFSFFFDTRVKNNLGYVKLAFIHFTAIKANISIQPSIAEIDVTLNQYFNHTISSFPENFQPEDRQCYKQFENNLTYFPYEKGYRYTVSHLEFKTSWFLFHLEFMKFSTFLSADMKWTIVCYSRPSWKLYGTAIVNPLFTIARIVRAFRGQIFHFVLAEVLSVCSPNSHQWP